MIYAAARCIRGCASVPVFSQVLSCYGVHLL